MSIYERELREILGGNREVIDRVCKSLSEDEREKYRRILHHPFITVRAAGSLGIADIVAIRGDMSFIVEIKVRKEEEILCDASGVLPIFAYRIKGKRGDAWRIFTMEMENVEGTGRKLHRILPKLEKSKGGNYIMRWKKGMKLADFIALIA